MCLCFLSLYSADAGKLREATAALPARIHLLVEARCLLKLRSGECILSPSPGRQSQEQESVRYTSFVSKFAEEVQALAAQFLCPLCVVQDKGQMCCCIECPGQDRKSTRLNSSHT